MESVQRSVMMLKPSSAAHIDQKIKAVLKMQSTKNGLMIDLSAPSLPTQDCDLYLFDQNGSGHLGGEITEGHLQTTLSSMPLQSVAGAAVIARRTLAFCYHSIGLNWADIAARFKFAHTPPPPVPNVIERAPLTQESPLHADEPLVAQELDTAEPDESKTVSDSPGACDTCPHVIRQDKINPFPSAFPNSEWVKISYPGPAGWWHYISGKIRSGDAVIAKVLGVPGEYGMAPPIWLEGFGTYMRCATPDAGGYWLMFQDAETGEVLDMGLSPRDG